MRLREMIRAMLALMLLGGALASCGQTTQGEFDPGIAEEFIRNKARADIQNNPALAVQEPQDPEVECREESPAKTDPAAATRFQCNVRILGPEGSKLGRQRWETLVEFDSVSGDSVVRESRLLSSSVDPAPQP